MSYPYLPRTVVLGALVLLVGCGSESGGPRLAKPGGVVPTPSL